MILNLRGIAGSGISTLGRQIVHDYGVSPERLSAEAAAMPDDRRLFHLLPHPAGGPSLAVLGPFAASADGTPWDGLRARADGLAEAFHIAGRMAEQGHDVLLGGLPLSWDHRWSAALARAHPLHVIYLATTPEEGARRVRAQRELPDEAMPRLVTAATGQQQAVENACARLAPSARVEALLFPAALARARRLLGLAGPAARAA
jgi:hypothetical protein